MPKKISYLLPFFCWLTSFGQSETKEHFVGEILSQTPYSSWKDIYLSDTASGWGKFDFVDSISMITPTLRNSIPDSSISELVANCAKSFSEKWRSISKVKVVNVNSLKFTKQKRNSLMFKREWAFISNVVFDNSETFAMIRMGRVCGKFCGDSCIYFFKKVSNKWQLTLKVGCITM